MGQKSLHKRRLCIAGKDIEIYPGVSREHPILYLNTYQKEGDQVYHMLQACQCPDFTLAVVSGLAWEHDMTPWEAPPVVKEGLSFTGGAGEYLRVLTEEIVPAVEREVTGKILWRGLAGYSLAGLFALYTAYQTPLFARIASMSGSLWFPGFQEYVFSHEMRRVPERLYLSLGERESRTQNLVLRTVRERTEAIHAFYQRKGITANLQWNPGNHFQNAIRRTAAGIADIL